MLLVGAGHVVANDDLPSLGMKGCATASSRVLWSQNETTPAQGLALLIGVALFLI